jgi:hypothetical protein
MTAIPYVLILALAVGNPSSRELNSIAEQYERDSQDRGMARPPPRA